MKYTENEFLSALKLHQNNKFNEAEKKYLSLLSFDSKNHQCLYLLGTLYAQTNKNDKAIELLNASIKINNQNADAFYNLGNIYQNTNLINKAIISYTETLKLNKNYLKAYLNLGQIFSKRKEKLKAIDYYKVALKIDGNYNDALNNLGTIYAEDTEYKIAINLFKKAILSNPTNHRSYYNLGTVYQKIKDYEKAIINFEKSISIIKIYPQAYNNLGYLYKQINNFEKSKIYYEEGIKQNPSYALIKMNYGNLLDIMCEHEAAINLYNSSILDDPLKLSTRWAKLNTFPFVYKNQDEIIKYKKNFQNEILSIKDFIGKNELDKQETLNGLLNSTNFYLHYQGTDNTKLQIDYARLIESLTENIFGNKIDIKIMLSTDKIKIGFVSPCFIEHSVMNTHKNFLIKLNNKKFETFVYHINEETDRFTESIKRKVDYFYHDTNIENIMNKIKADSLNILIFLDIGMSPLMQIIGSLRFAPIQINGNAQPVTSGFKNIDYVITSQYMEPEEAEMHYSEKLIKLCGSGQCYDNPKIISNNNLPNKKTIFFNLQNLFKLLPNEDHIFIEIIKKIKNCEIWFVESRNKKGNSIFRERLTKICKNNNIDFDEFIKMKKRRSQKDFFNLIDESDIIIDSLNWSGNNTSHQAISLNKPIITLPGKFMRSRHTYALLKEMNIEETIAHDKKNYIEIALQLTNKTFRDKIIKKIGNNKYLLFDNIKPVKDLEVQLLDLVNLKNN